MHTFRIAAALTLAASLSVTSLGLVSCSSATDQAAAQPVQHQFNYKGTASVGDFLTFAIDTTAHTFSYSNLSNGLSGSGTFVVNSDGSYSISESSNCFTDAFDVPGYALVLRGTKTGPSQNTVSLITALDAQTNTVAGVANKNYNYMQFRTNSGGLEVGHVGMGAQAQITHASYWPYGAFNGGTSAYGGVSTFPVSPVEDAPTGALKLTIPSGSSAPAETDYIFATTSGLLAVDTGNGSLICLEQAASSSFDPANAGTYQALCYAKGGAATGSNNTETALVAGDVTKSTITITAGGGIQVTDAGSATIATGTLAPVSGSALATGITFPCPGLFHATAGSQEIFVVFSGNSVMFSSFKPNAGNASLYDYFYGIGLKHVGGAG